MDVVRCQSDAESSTHFRVSLGAGFKTVSEQGMTERLAVLVDGDNVSGAYASRISAVARDHGEPDVMRVYADAQRKSEWLSAPGFRMIHAGMVKMRKKTMKMTRMSTLAFGKSSR